MSTLDVSQNPLLTNLIVGDNQLTSLDVINNLALTDLDARNNQLTTLNLPPSVALTTINAQNNQLVSLDISQSTELNNLILNNNLFTGTAIVDQFHAMWSDSLAVPPKQLSTGTLDVSHNRLSGNLPNLLDIILKLKTLAIHYPST